MEENLLLSQGQKVMANTTGILTFFIIIGILKEAIVIGSIFLNLNPQPIPENRFTLTEHLFHGLTGGTVSQMIMVTTVNLLLKWTTNDFGMMSKIQQSVSSCVSISYQ